jgi:hypothetical protein
MQHTPAPPGATTSSAPLESDPEPSAAAPDPIAASASAATAECGGDVDTSASRRSFLAARCSARARSGCRARWPLPSAQNGRAEEHGQPLPPAGQRQDGAPDSW